MPDREYFNNRRRNRRQALIRAKGGKCEKCGSRDDLQFDHKNPQDKSFRISDRLDAPMDVLIEEVDKCSLLCRKCHQEKTNKNREHGQPKARHGTLHMYKKYKCRCDKCRKAMSDYNKKKKISFILNRSIGFNKLAFRL